MALAANTTATPPWALAGALLAVLTPWLVKLSRARALAQPTPAHPDAEERVVAHVLRCPAHYVYIHQLRAEHFTDTRLGALWSVIASANADVTIPDVDGDSKRALRLLEACEASVATDLVERLERAALDEPTRKRFAALVERHVHTGVGASGTTSRDAMVEQASLVYNAGVDRLDYVGNSRVELTGDPQQPLRRTLAPSGMLRRVIVAVMLAVGGALSLAVGSGRNADTAGWFVTAALLVLTIGSVIWALVDQDTMYIDLPTFYTLTGAAWLLVIVAGIVGDGLTGALRGLLTSLGVVVFIEVVNQIFRRVRGQHGMGGGDYLLIVATIGVPVAVTGDLLLGQWILILSLLAGVIGWGITRLTKPGFTKASPYAFGPYLASGWLLALGLWVVR
jgi:hypothetical protein